MNVKKSPINNYKKFLLNRSTISTPFVEFIEHCIVTEDEAAHHCFHKILIVGWAETMKNLYDCLGLYLSSQFIPIAETTIATAGSITFFYTSSLSFINKIIRFDFMFPYQQNMFNIDIVFYDKTSTEMFDNVITVDDIVTGVVNKRFSEKFELDLSNFCRDQEFIDKRICFYKISLLAQFKILMLRIGRDTKVLNLSNNEIVQPPIEILNFFIKSDLTSINLSSNNIQSISDLFRVSSKIEKLWVEGNPLCDEIETAAYVKSITMKFPRLTELDGIKINETGLHFPFNRNFIEVPDRYYTKMLVEKFLKLYFSHYDTPKRPAILGFYRDKSTLTLTTGFTASEEIEFSTYASHARNVFRRPSLSRVHSGKELQFVLCERLPATVHDPSTFTVDVLHHDRQMLLLVVAGVFKEEDVSPHHANLFHFRRTFAFRIEKPGSSYVIMNELMHITNATLEQAANSFKHPIRNHTSLSLMEPLRDESDAVVKMFSYITMLKKEEAEVRLRMHKWDIREALREIVEDMTKNSIHHNSFIEDDELSDIDALIDDDMVE